MSAYPVATDCDILRCMWITLLRFEDYTLFSAVRLRHRLAVRSCRRAVRRLYLQQVFLDDGWNIIDRDSAIGDAFGVDDHHRPT